MSVRVNCIIYSIYSSNVLYTERFNEKTLLDAS